jgi:hypothetical protein
VESYRRLPPAPEVLRLGCSDAAGAPRFEGCAGDQGSIS